MPRSLTVVKARHGDGDVTRIGAELVDVDAAGVWVLLPMFTPHLLGDGRWPVHVGTRPTLGLIPDSPWWTAWFGPFANKVDMSTHSWTALDDGEVGFCDVALDVVWRWGEGADLYDLVRRDLGAAVEPYWRRQQAGEGWVLAAGLDARATTAAFVVADHEPVLITTTDDDHPLTSLVVEAASRVRRLTAPPVRARR